MVLIRMYTGGAKNMYIDDLCSVFPLMFFSVPGSSSGYHVEFSCRVSIVSFKLCLFLVSPDLDPFEK